MSHIGQIFEGERGPLAMVMFLRRYLYASNDTLISFDLGHAENAPLTPLIISRVGDAFAVGFSADEARRFATMVEMTEIDVADECAPEHIAILNRLVDALRKSADQLDQYIAGMGRLN